MIFDSITKYTIVENPHPPQGGVPLFLLLLLFVVVVVAVVVVVVGVGVVVVVA